MSLSWILEGNISELRLQDCQSHPILAVKSCVPNNLCFFFPFLVYKKVINLYVLDAYGMTRAPRRAIALPVALLLVSLGTNNPLTTSPAGGLT
jgi:hypothetical protein